MRGKEKCKALKEIRQKIAEQNDIAFAVSECTHQGDCKGTCPKCESELRYLERQLAIRQSLGKAVVVAGISAGMCAPMVACNPIEAIGDAIEDVYYIMNPPEELEGATVPAEPLAGDVEYIPEDVQGMEGPNPDEVDEQDLEDIDGGLEEYDPDALLPSEEDMGTLTGNVVIDPEYLDEE